MTLPEPAVADANWLEPADLYLTAGPAVELDRPIYQGDVFADVAIPVLPDAPPAGDRVELDISRGPAMVVPHPCQCYNGDRLRPFLTLAPVTVVPHYANFRPDRTGAKDKFALPDLPRRNESGDWATATCVADFGRLFSAPSGWLRIPDRIACLSHQGLGLLAKRVLAFQLRFTPDLTTAMGFTAAEWNEPHLVQAWVREHRSLEGLFEMVANPYSDHRRWSGRRPCEAVRRSRRRA